MRIRKSQGDLHWFYSFLIDQKQYTKNQFFFIANCFESFNKIRYFNGYLCEEMNCKTRLSFCDIDYIKFNSVFKK